LLYIKIYTIKNGLKKIIYNNVKKFESEVSTGNASGKAGIASLPFGKGYYQSDGCDGSSGKQFTPNSEPRLKSYKKLKHSKKNMKNKLKKFKDFVKEDATATAGNTGGMGGVVAASPSSTPGDVAGSTIGSGDIGATLGTYTIPINSIEKEKKNKKKKKKKEKNENVDTDNFTARYYDDFDDEEEKANELDLQEFNPKNRKIQMFEEYENRKV
jgi:hypothetical protein